jgi:hypothetical protein
MKSLVDIWNAAGDKVVGVEVETLLKPLGRTITDGAVYVCTVLTDWMPEIGAGVVVICGIGMMITGNVPKWLARLAIGLGVAIIWLGNA